MSGAGWCGMFGSHGSHDECHGWGDARRDDPSCESCGRRGRAMVTATIGGETFALCSTCGEDAAEHGAEVTS